MPHKYLHSAQTWDSPNSPGKRLAARVGAPLGLRTTWFRLGYVPRPSKRVAGTRGKIRRAVQMTSSADTGLMMLISGRTKSFVFLQHIRTPRCWNMLESRMETKVNARIVWVWFGANAMSNMFHANWQCGKPTYVRVGTRVVYACVGVTLYRRADVIVRIYGLT